MTVYAITADFTGTSWAEACQKTSKLDADIQRLAKASGEAVHMHQYKEQMLGAPVVLVECSEAFLDKIKRLPLFDAAPQIEPPEAMTPRHKGPKA